MIHLRFFVVSNNVLKKDLPMTQQELEQELANITGEDLDTIQSRGFSLEEPDDFLEVIKSQIDWDLYYIV